MLIHVTVLLAILLSTIVSLQIDSLKSVFKIIGLELFFSKSLAKILCEDEIFP